MINRLVYIEGYACIYFYYYTYCMFIFEIKIRYYKTHFYVF